MQIAKKGNDYLEDDWYGRAFAADSGYWSEPYMDDAGRGGLMCSYSVPIHDHTGRKVGVFGADISLDWLHEQLKAIDKEYNFFKGFIKSKRNIDTLSIFSSSIIIDSVGTFIVHPDKKRILKDNFYEVLQTTLPEPHTLIEHMSQAVSQFVGDTEQSDDLTMLALQYVEFKKETR